MANLKTFKSLGVSDELCDACEKQNWRIPTDIQEKAIPLALEGKDIIGLAQTGSGKTAAFAIPILQDLQKDLRERFALVITPTRELAIQIAEQFRHLGSFISGLSLAILVGGLDAKVDAKVLSKPFHIVIATPGRLLDHLENTKGFSLKTIKYLVLDEADKILGENFEIDLNYILQHLPTERRTYLYSATMTQKVEKLQKASLKNPAKLFVSSKYGAVSTLKEYMVSVPMDPAKRCCYLAKVALDLLKEHSAIIFCSTCLDTQLLASFLLRIGFYALALNSKINQATRLRSLELFQKKKPSILVATDIASRGLDIPDVEYVINFHLPLSAKDYRHRVGRTARAGKPGTALTFVSQDDIPSFLAIEKHLNKKLDPYEIDDSEVQKISPDAKNAFTTAKMLLEQQSMKRKEEEPAGKKKKSKKHRAS